MAKKQFKRSGKAKYPTREAWLNAAVAGFRPLFKDHKYDVPDLRVSCGWPSKGGLARKRKTIGECWSKNASEGGRAEIFMSPIMGKDTAPRVLDVLAHEMVHAIVGHDAGHGKEFKKCAVAIGLEGKMTATTAGPELEKFCINLAKELGPYPHDRLEGMTNGKKKDSTRMLKLVCTKEGCECGGYIVRTTQKWLEVGNPACPFGGEMAEDE